MNWVAVLASIGLGVVAGSVGALVTLAWYFHRDRR